MALIEQAGPDRRPAGRMRGAQRLTDQATASAAPLPAADRLRAFFDDGTMRRHDVPGDRCAVLCATGLVAGRRVYAYAQDETRSRGAVGPAEADAIVALLRCAEREASPVVGLVASSGARIQQGLASLGGFGRVFTANVQLGRRVPQISVITDTTAGGAAYSAALTDFVVMAEDSRMFLTGPGVLSDVTGQDVTSAQLGGPRVHSRNGVADIICDTEAAAFEAASLLLGYLPSAVGRPVPTCRPEAPEVVHPENVVPADPRTVYDVRGVIAALADAGSVLEMRAGHARNMVTSLIRIDGAPVGVVANQPWSRGGVIDSLGARKGARFVDSCNRFGLPIVVLVDTPGFIPGVRHESDGIIDNGAELVRAFIEASVPTATVVLRKAFGGAYIAMNSKELGATHTLAWPRAELGVMGAHQAVGVVNRRELASSADPVAARAALAATYAGTHLTATTALSTGLIDEVIHPSNTRQRLSELLRSEEASHV